MANVRLADGKISGVRCGVLYYSMKRIVSIKDLAKSIKDELVRVKKIVCEKLTSPWIISNAPEGYNAVHKEDPVTHLNRSGKGTEHKLADAGIMEVKQIKTLTLSQQAHLKANHKVSEIYIF